MRIFLLAAGLLILLIGCATPATTPASTPLPSPPTSEADDVTMVTEEPTPLTAVSPAATSQIFVPLLPGNGQPATTAAPTPEPPVAPPAETTEEPPAPTSPPVPISTPYVSFIPD